MTFRRMHPGEFATDVSLVHRLLSAQFPHWAHLPIRRVASAGTDNALYRLGEDLAVRLPRIHWAAELAHKEWQWLPKLALHLPLPIPAPLAKGAPGEGYPRYWSVTPLAAVRDAATRGCIAEASDLFSPAELTAAWDAALHTPDWQRPPVWIHGDLQSGNLLAMDGRLAAVIDWGVLCVGDPAAELPVAGNLFPADARAAFRAALGFDDATWSRGRGWALSVALVALPSYRHTNPILAEMSRRTIAAVLAEG